MVHMKLTKDDLNVKELNIKYEGPQFERYHGDIPKSGTVLNARVTKMWWTVSSNGNSMIKLIAIAEQNSGRLAEFNGLPVWENLTFVKEAAGRYGAFFACFDLTIEDVFKHLDVEPDDDNVGTPINSISDWEVGSDDALCQIVTRRGTDQDGNLRAEIDWDGWLPFNEDMAAEYAEENRPSRRSRSDGAKSAASSRRGAATTRGSRTRRAEPELEDEDEYNYEDEPDDTDVEDDEDEEDLDGYEDEDEGEDVEEEPPARSRRGTRPTRPARASRSDGGRSGRSSSRSVHSDARSGGRSASRSGRRSDEARRASRATDRDRANRGSVDEPPF